MVCADVMTALSRLFYDIAVGMQALQRARKAILKHPTIPITTILPITKVEPISKVERSFCSTQLTSFEFITDATYDCKQTLQLLFETSIIVHIIRLLDSSHPGALAPEN